jgi:hypothetical protein
MMIPTWMEVMKMMQTMMGMMMVKVEMEQEVVVLRRGIERTVRSHHHHLRRSDGEAVTRVQTREGEKVPSENTGKDQRRLEVNRLTNSQWSKKMSESEAQKILLIQTASASPKQTTC